MKKKSQRQKPTKRKFSILRQICNFIPNHLVPQLARETGVEDDARTYTCGWQKPRHGTKSLILLGLSPC